MIDFDNVLKELGERGRYQQVMFLLLCVPATIPAAFIAFNQVFISGVPDHWCRVGQLANLSLDQRKLLSLPRTAEGALDQCAMYDVDFDAVWRENGDRWPAVGNSSWPTVSCPHGWEYDTTYYDETLTTKFDLVCGEKWRVDLCTTLFYTGSLFGNVLFGWVADKWGRRTSILLLLCVEIPLSIVASFSSNYTMYTVIRTAVGFTFPALYQIPFILSLEIMGPSYRTFTGMMICVFFAMAMALLAGIAYLCRHWFILSLCCSIPFITLVSYWWVVPESPRWLIQQGRIQEAENIVQKMAKVNKKHVPKNYLDSLKALNESTPAPSEPVSIQNVVCGYPNLRKKFLIIAFSWTVNAIVYNGLSYNATQLGVSDYLGFFIAAIVEVPMYFIILYTMDRWGRKRNLCATMMMGGLACISCILVPKERVWVTVTLAMIGKFGIAGSFAVIYVFAGELLPTVIRSQAMALASFFAGLGLLGFPHILALSKYSRVLPLIIMGVLTVLGALVSFFLPETAGQHLPETLEEGERFGKHANRTPAWLRCCGAIQRRRCSVPVDTRDRELHPVTKVPPYNGFTEVATSPGQDDSDDDS